MQDNYMRDLLKDLGSNRTPSNSITLTSGKDEGAIDVTRKDTINATATAGEKITMYHPSGSTIQVFPNEVQLFISNGYSTTPSAGVPQRPVVVAPQQPAAVAPQQPGGIVTTPTPVVGPEMVPTGGIGRPGGTLTPSLGVSAPSRTSGPQGVTVPMDSEEDLALQNDPNYNETVNDDGTVTYTPSSEIAIPDEDAPVGSPEQQAAVNSPGNFEAPTDNPVGINGNPRLIFDEEKGWISNPAYTFEEKVGDDSDTLAGGKPNRDDYPDTRGGGKQYQDDLDAWNEKNKPVDSAEVDANGNPKFIQTPRGLKPNPNYDTSTPPADQTQGIHGNDKYIQNESGEWISNPAYTFEEKVDDDGTSTTETVIDKTEVTGTPEEQAQFEADFEAASAQSDEHDRQIAEEAKAELDNATTVEESDSILDGLKGLFKDGELAKSLILYAASRAAGFSHSGSAKFAYDSTDLFGDKNANAEYNTYASGVDTALANGIFGDPTSQEAIDRANSLKQQFLTNQSSNSSGASGISKNAKVMVTSDGRRAVFDANLGGYRYTDGDREPVTNDVQTYEPNSAAGVRQINKPRRDWIQKNQVGIDNIDFVSTLEVPKGGFFSDGQIGSLFGKIRGIYGGETESDTYAKYQAGLQNNLSLAGRPPGPLSEKEWDYLRAGVPNPRSNPEEYKKYMKAYGTFLREQNAKLRFMNDYMYKNTGASELDAMNAWHNTAAGNTAYSGVPGSSGGTSTGDGTHDDNKYG